jgi:hypothetical protein
MNRKAGFVLLFAVLAASVAAPSLFGQRKEISKAKFVAIREAAYSKLEKSAYRVKWTPSINEASIADGREAVISSTSEFAPPHKKRVITVWKTATGTREEETIRIADKEFTKIDGHWKTLEKPVNRFTAVGDVLKPVDDETYLHVGSEQLRGVNAEIYEEIVHTEYTYDNRKITYTTLNRLWIGMDGRLLKAEWKQSGSNGVVTSSSISDYEYDPTIRIEAPIK